MRVLHLDSGREMRGGQWQVLYLLRGLATAGVSSTLLARPASPLHAAAVAEGFVARPLSLSSVRSLASTHDVIHAHDARSHTLALAAPGSPLVVARRVAFPVRESWLSRWKYGRACRYLAVSHYVGETLSDAGVSSEKIAVVPDAVPVAGEADGPRDRVVSLHFDDPMKGTNLVREAASLAGVDVLLSRNLIDDLSRARLFVYITHQEGLGSAVLHAMAAGVPVIASRVGGLPEAVEHEVTGLLVNNDTREIAAAIRRLLDEPALAAALGERARRRIEENFTVPMLVARTLQVYQEALQCSKS